MNKELTRQQYLDLYYFMRLNRAVEDMMVKLFRQNKIVGGLYSSLGQEAVSVGSAYALEKKDWLAPMIRNIGALLVKGVPPRDIFMQHMAKYDSPTKGKDGTSHFGDLENLHIVSPISMLGDLIPVMTGVAIAGRYLGQKIVAMTWIGDGGSSTGVFHEGLNFAAVQKAPFVLVLENNQWAYSTPVKRQVPLENLADRAKAYGIPSYSVDGNDVVAVYTTAKEAVDRARNGEGPILIEVKTFRRLGHAQHDPAEYVPKEMRAYWEARDPILLYEKFLTGQKSLDDKEQERNRRQNRQAAFRGARLRGKFPDASGGICRTGRLLHRRRLPQDCPEMATAHCGSDAAKIERRSGVDSAGIWQRQRFRRRQRPDSFRRHAEARRKNRIGHGQELKGHRSPRSGCGKHRGRRCETGESCREGAIQIRGENSSQGSGEGSGQCPGKK